MLTKGILAGQDPQGLGAEFVPVDNAAAVKSIPHCAEKSEPLHPMGSDGEARPVRQPTRVTAAMASGTTASPAGV